MPQVTSTPDQQPNIDKSTLDLITSKIASQLGGVEIVKENDLIRSVGPFQLNFANYFNQNGICSIRVTLDGENLARIKRFDTIEDVLNVIPNLSDPNWIKDNFIMNGFWEGVDLNGKFFEL